MTLEELRLSFADENHPANKNPKHLNFFHELCQDSHCIKMELNTSYYRLKEIVEIMSRLIRKPVDPPIYGDFGKNTSFGKKMFSSTTS